MVVEIEGEPGAQLYAAPDPEEDERAKDAMDDLAAAVLQLQVRAASCLPRDDTVHLAHPSCTGNGCTSWRRGP